MRLGLSGCAASRVLVVSEATSHTLLTVRTEEKKPLGRMQEFIAESDQNVIRIQVDKLPNRTVKDSTADAYKRGRVSITAVSLIGPCSLEDSLQQFVQYVRESRRDTHPYAYRHISYTLLHSVQSTPRPLYT
jgi:hypothetical protein